MAHVSYQLDNQPIPVARGWCDKCDLQQLLDCTAGILIFSPIQQPFLYRHQLDIGGNSLRSHRAALVKFSRKITSKNP
jgi:hypothetical protein